MIMVTGEQWRRVKKEKKQGGLAADERVLNRPLGLREESSRCHGTRKKRYKAMTMLCRRVFPEKYKIRFSSGTTLLNYIGMRDEVDWSILDIHDVPKNNNYAASEWDSLEA